MLRAILQYVNLRATVKSVGIRVGANISAVVEYVNMRATFELSSPWYETEHDQDGGSVFNTRAINEWTLNG